VVVSAQVTNYAERTLDESLQEGLKHAAGAGTLRARYLRRPGDLPSQARPGTLHLAHEGQLPILRRRRVRAPAERTQFRRSCATAVTEFSRFSQSTGGWAALAQAISYHHRNLRNKGYQKLEISAKARRGTRHAGIVSSISHRAAEFSAS